MLEIDIPEIRAELIAVFNAYECALIENDIAALNSLFWNSDRTTRFGTREMERLYGHVEISSFRVQRGPIDQRRKLQNTRITTFGRNFGVANTEFLPAGSSRIGRQSQIWIRTVDGWKIASAHVSYGI